MSMKALVVYDSAFGNTERIAQAIGDALDPLGDIQTLSAGNARPEQLVGLTLLIVGSPTQRFRPTAAISRFLKSIPKDGLKGVRVAAFDTRLTVSQIEATPVLPFFVRLFGYAAKPISDRLKKKGGEVAIPPEGFYVEGMEGPLKGGESERAADWARRIVATR
jgi:flavodoxin